MDVLRELEREKRSFTYALVGIQGLHDQGWDALGIDISHYLPSNIAENIRYPMNELISTRFKMNKMSYVAANRIGFHMLGTAKELMGEDDDLWGAIHRNPTVHFLEQIRNGVFHGNQFKFRGGQPKFTAEWRGFELTDEFDSEPVFTDVRGEIEYTNGELELIEGVMEYGDAIALFDDVVDIVAENKQ